MIKNNITFKLTMSFVLIVLISMLAIGAFFINMFRNYTFENKKQNMFDRANEISSVAQKYVQSPSALAKFPEFIELLDSFASARIWITDKNGNIVTMSKMQLCPMMQMNKLPPEAVGIIKNALAGKRISSEGFSKMYNEPMLTVGVPILGQKNEIVGTVLLHAPVTGVTNIINDAFNFLLIALIIALILAAGLGILYSTIFTRPLKTMNRAALEMTNGNYSIRTNIDQSDEIGQLSNSLDLLASKLGNTIDQLYQEKNKLNDVMGSISEGLVAFDVKMKIINYNEALKDLLGYGSDDNIEEKITEDLKKYELEDIFKTVISTGSSHTKITEWSGKSLKLTLSPVKSSQGDIIGVVSLILDISESERLEQMRKDFIANVSHEFRTPLTLIRGSVEAILDKAVSSQEDIDKYNKRILSETRGLERLVSDLLDLSRMQSGTLALRLEKIDLVTLAEEVIRSMQIIAKQRQIQIEFKAGQNVPPLLGDYDRLRQLLIIFLDNAIKYSFDNTKIKVNVDARDSKYVYLSIKDNGIGIPKENIPFIWDRFYQLGKNSGSSVTGTGLGLAIAKYLINLHSGIVKVESEVNIGTNIEISLPVNI